MLVTVALANKMARIIWALLVKGGTYRTPTAAASADHDREDVRASGGEYGATVGETRLGQPGLSTVLRARFG
jgi:hypothetical protein